MLLQRDALPRAGEPRCWALGARYYQPSMGLYRLYRYPHQRVISYLAISRLGAGR